MRGTWPTIRRALGGPLSALMLLVSVAGPLMDGADLHLQTRVVDCGEPASHRWGHDHRLCLQVAANQALATYPILHPTVWTVRQGDTDGVVPTGCPAPEGGAPSARAPPRR